MTRFGNDLPLDSQNYRRTIGLFATGVTIVATEYQGEVRGITVNALTSVSLEPLMLLVCIDKTAYIADHLLKAKRFSVNILGANQEAISQYFANMWKQDTPPPFTLTAWVENIPFLENCLGALACRTHEVIEGGDHWVFLGEVIALRRQSEPVPPLLYYQGRYRQLK